MVVHWHTDIWIDIQLRYFARYIPQPFTTMAFLNGIDKQHYHKFDYSDDKPIRDHAIKLNQLAEKACDIGGQDDILLFIDGDAFPIADIAPLIDQLEDYPLIAVKREENNGDQQPHPCFCLTTVKFWREIDGDWRAGAKWRDSNGRLISDVGGMMYGKLAEKNICWKPLLRSNKKNIHPLWFGVYGDVAYHHGAGFRDKLCRLDAVQGVDLFSRLWLSFLFRTNMIKRAPQLNKKLTFWIHNYMRRRNLVLDKKIFHLVQHDDDFAKHCDFI